MTKEQQDVVYKRSEYTRMRNLLMSVALVFLTVGLGLGATTIKTVAVNDRTLQDHEVRIKDLELYKSSVYQFSDLVHSIMIYTNHMTALMSRNADKSEEWQQDVEEWQKRYEELWSEINFRNTGLLREGRTRGGETEGKE